MISIQLYVVLSLATIESHSLYIKIKGFKFYKSHTNINKNNFLYFTHNIIINFEKS